MGISPASVALMRLCLIQGIIQISGEIGLTHWCAIMAPPALDLNLFPAGRSDGRISR
jgi:hypothetical protein